MAIVKNSTSQLVCRISQVIWYRLCPRPYRLHCPRCPCRRCYFYLPPICIVDFVFAIVSATVVVASVFFGIVLLFLFVIIFRFVPLRFFICLSSHLISFFCLPSPSYLHHPHQSQFACCRLVLRPCRLILLLDAFNSIPIFVVGFVFAIVSATVVVASVLFYIVLLFLFVCVLIFLAFVLLFL